VSIDERLVHPALGCNFCQQCIEQGEVGPRVDGEVQDVFLARIDLAGGNGRRAPRVDGDDTDAVDGLIAELRLLLVQVVPRMLGTQ
jgi:hypothetical protein